LAFAARAVARRAPSVAVLVDPTKLDRPKAPRSDIFWAEVLEVRLGRRLCEALAAKSDSITPGPMDLRGALVELLPDIGGYWLCRRVRPARGAAGGSIVPEVMDAVDEMLL
jgi:hypothetical protein